MMNDECDCKWKLQTFKHHPNSILEAKEWVKDYLEMYFSMVADVKKEEMETTQKGE